MNLRKAARGRPCTLRLPGCDGGGETTVLAHIRSHTGLGRKPLDIHGLWACSNCHDLLDRRRYDGELSREAIMAQALRALIETQTTLHEEGLI